MSEVGEGQHRRWRDNITSNIQKGMKAAGRNKSRIVAVTTAANISGSNMMIAERIGEVARALNDRDVLVTALHEENKRGKYLVGRLILAGGRGDQDEIDHVTDMLRSWCEEEGHVDQIHGAISAVPSDEMLAGMGAVKLDGEAPAEAMEPQS